MNANGVAVLLVGVVLWATPGRAQESAATNAMTTAEVAPAAVAPQPPATAEGVAVPAPEAAPALDLGRWTLGGSVGDDTSVVELGVMLPFWHTGNTWFFVNPRGAVVENGGQELNAGLVVRHWLPARSVILGANAFYDLRQTDADNTFHQLSGGVEVLSRWVDARANLYYPLTDPESLSVFEDRAVSTAGSLRTTTTTRFRVSEEALQGIDGELGVWLPYVSRRVPTGVFVGAYDFDSEFDGEDVRGVKARLECRLHPNVTLDAEWFDDTAVRASEYVVGVRVQLPFDFWNGWRMGPKGSSARVLPFASRLDEPVRRDFQVRTLQTGDVPVSQSSAQQSIARPRRPRVCHDYAQLDADGNVVIITVCD